MIKVDEKEIRATLIYVRKMSGQVSYEMVEPIVNTLNKWLQAAPELKEVTKDVKGDNA